LPRHRAAGDALASLEVFCAQLRRYPQQLGNDAASAAAFCTSKSSSASSDGELPEGLALSDGAVVLQFGKHRGKAVAHVARADPSYLRWLIRPEHNPDPRLSQIVRRALPPSN
jgi:DNA polymerase-3 subunit epsilon